MQIWALINDTFRESRNTRLFWVILAISTVFVAALACIGFDRQGLSLFFGAWHVDHPVLKLGSAEVAGFYGAIVSNLLIDAYIGWVGVVLALIATSGMFPALMAAGAVEVLLSKPIPRWKIFVGKYLGALGFVTVQASYLIVAVILVIGVRSGEWMWGCLWCIPLLVVLFSYVYCIAVLVAVRSPNGLTCLLMALAFWFVCFLVQTGHQMMNSNLFSGASSEVRRETGAVHNAEDNPTAGNESSSSFSRFRQATRVLYHILPKTAEITVICGRVTRASTVSEVVGYFDPDQEIPPADMNQFQAAEQLESGINATHSLLTSLAFEAVVLLIAGWKFCRRDF